MNRTMLLRDLLTDVAGVPGDLRISGLVMDSREVKPGYAFVAIAGFGAHGLAFAEQARAAGAGAVLFEPPAPAEKLARRYLEGYFTTSANIKSTAGVPTILWQTWESGGKTARFKRNLCLTTRVQTLMSVRAPLKPAKSCTVATPS